MEEREDASTDAERQHVWGIKPGHRDELILRDRDTTVPPGGSTLDERLCCLMDYYDPTSMIDTAGAVQERYRFSAFGLRTILNASWVEQASSSFEVDFAYKGQFIDTETAYYNYGYRYYSSQIGRWLSRDPIEEEGGLNLYAFTENGTVNSLDRLGLQLVPTPRFDPDLENAGRGVESLDKVVFCKGEIGEKSSEGIPYPCEVCSCIDMTVLLRDHDRRLIIGGSYCKLLGVQDELTVGKIDYREIVPWVTFRWNKGTNKQGVDCSDVKKRFMGDPNAPNLVLEIRVYDTSVPESERQVYLSTTQVINNYAKTMGVPFRSRIEEHVGKRAELFLKVGGTNKACMHQYFSITNTSYKKRPPGFNKHSRYF